MTFDSVLDENEKNIQDLGDSTTVIFAWDTCVYTANQGPGPEPDLYPGGGGGNDDGNGGVDVGQGGGESEGVGEAG